MSHRPTAPPSPTEIVVDGKSSAPHAVRPPAAPTPRAATPVGGLVRRLGPWLLGLALLVGLGFYRHWFAVGGSNQLTALGSLEATEVAVSSEVTARIVEITLNEGDVAQVGQPLVRLDDTIARLQLQQAVSSPSDQQMLQAQLSKYVITAPISGAVLVRSAEPGEMAVSGAPLLTLADIAHPKVTLYVPQRDLGRIAVGQPVAVEAEAVPDVSYDGIVESVADHAEYTPRNTQTTKDRENLVFAVKVRILNADQRIKPGMNVSARFVEG